MNRSRMLRLVVLATAAATFLVTAGSAIAHTNVAESDPGDGAIVETAPTQIMVRFGQESFPAPGQISDATLVVIDPCGTQVDKKDSSVDMRDSSVTVSSGGVPSGRYEIHWFATAADGAAQSGLLDFNVSQGEPCTKVKREDPADDVEAGLDVTSVEGKRTRRGARLAIQLADSVACATLAPKAEAKTTVLIDTNSDRNADITGALTCKKGIWSVTLEPSEQEATGSLAAARPTATKLIVRVPRQVLVGHVDVWIETSSEAAECESKNCFDRAPDLGLIRAY